MNVKEMTFMPVPQKGKKMTRNEWINTLNLEEKANLIYDLLWNRNRSLFGEIGYVRDVDSVRKWLKQPHQGE